MVGLIAVRNECSSACGGPGSGDIQSRGRQGQETLAERSNPWTAEIPGYDSLGEAASPLLLSVVRRISTFPGVVSALIGLPCRSVRPGATFD